MVEYKGKYVEGEAHSNNSRTDRTYARIPAATIDNISENVKQMPETKKQQHTRDRTRLSATNRTLINKLYSDI